MARTADPSAATKKAWLTRARNAGGGGVVQSKDDFAQAWTGVGKARPEDVSKLISLPVPGADDLEAGQISFEEFAGQAASSDRSREKVAAHLREGLRDLDLPDAVLDGLTGIEICFENQLAVPAGLLVRSQDEGLPIKGFYTGAQRKAQLNATYFADPWIYDDADRKPREVEARLAAEGGDRVVSKTAAHEMGHHAHLSKLGAQAALEWERLSAGGSLCRISDYGRTNTTEHFAEAFASYARPGAGGGGMNRKALKALEPKAYAFMERLWRDKSMWQPKGQFQHLAPRSGKL